jgi:hypothetical protein
LQPKKYTFKGKLPKSITLQGKAGDCESIKMEATPLPVRVNNATTGHKLQGSSIDSLSMYNWSYVTNWPYVMLSCVKTRAGLFCGKKLSRDLNKYAVPDELRRILHHFERQAPT